MAYYTPKDIGGFGRLADVQFKKRGEAREERRLVMQEQAAANRNELAQLQIKQTRSNLEKLARTAEIKAGLRDIETKVPEGENLFTTRYSYLMSNGAGELANKYMERQSKMVDSIYVKDPKEGIRVFNDTIGRATGTTLEFQEMSKTYGTVLKAVNDKTGKVTFLQRTSEGVEPIEGYSPITADKKKEISTKQAMISEYMTENPESSRGEAGLEVEKRLAAAKRGKGIQVSYDAEGKPVINIGGPPDMTRKTKGTLEADILEMDNQLIKSQRIIEQLKPEMLTIPGKFKGAYLNIKDLVTGELSEDEATYVREISTFRQNALESINAYIQSVTGAAMSNAEAKRLRQAVADAGDGILSGDGPTKFLGKLNETIRKGKLAKARAILLLEKGIKVDSENAESIESKYNYNDVRSMLNLKANELGAAYEIEYPNKTGDEIRDMVREEIRKGYGI